MKSVIGLALIAVFCVLEVYGVGEVTNVKLTIVDTNHETTGDRKLEFECTFTLAAGKTDKPVVRIFASTDANVPISAILYTHTVGSDAAGGVVDTDQIKKAEVVVDANKDINKFVVTKPTAPAAKYNCDVAYTGAPAVPGTKVQVYAKPDTVAFAVTVKDPAEKDKLIFHDDGHLDATCTYELGGGTIKKFEFYGAGKVIATSTDATLATFTYPDADFTKENVKATKDPAATKVTLSVDKLNEKSVGKYKCHYEVEDESEVKVTKPITSSELDVTRANGAAANVASLGLLVLAVTSYFKLSL